jgi:molybdopterin molybdotransferase
LFVKPLLLALAGSSRKQLCGIPAFAAARLRHAPGRTEFVPVLIEGTDAVGHCFLASLPRGSHRLSSLAAADGFAEIPRDAGDITPGMPLMFHPFNAGWAL